MDRRVADYSDAGEAVSVTRAQVERWLAGAGSEDVGFGCGDVLMSAADLCRSWLRLREALLKHGHHTYDCPATDNWRQDQDRIVTHEIKSCTCGWAEIEKELT